MWNALCEIADWEKCTIHQICTEVYDSKEDRASFTAALRVFLMAYYRSALLVDRQVDKIRRNLNDKTRAMKEKDNRYSIDKELEFSS